MTITSLQAFEELRFVWELLGAEFVFLLPFARTRERFLLRALAGAGALSLISLGYFLLYSLGELMPTLLFQWANCMWYISLALLSMACLYLCFELSFSNLLYMGIAGYAAQHLVYITLHEVLALGLWPGLRERLWLYCLLSLLVSALFYSLLYRLFARKLTLCGGQMFEDTPAMAVFQVGMLVLLMVSSFTGQHIFQHGQGVRYFGAAMDFLICLLILAIQYFSFRMVLSSREQAVIGQMLRDSERQYHHSRELIDLVNRSCHDIKHHLQAIKVMDRGERADFIRATEENLARYERLVHTDNEVLNTILAEKSLTCEGRGIRFSCAVDGVRLDFMSIPDLYALLGNAVDNAIEGVSPFEEADKRVISLTIHRRAAFVSIQTNNYCDPALRLRGDLPETTKADALRHGFGLKSIRYLAEKYGGTMTVSAEGGMFTLQIMLPVTEQAEEGPQE